MIEYLFNMHPVFVGLLFIAAGIVVVSVWCYCLELVIRAGAK